MEEKHEHEHEKDVEECKICEVFELFEALMEEGMSIEDSFHEAFVVLAEDLIEDVLDSSIGFENGYTQALRDIGEQASNAADALEKECSECDCGCEIDEDADIVYKELICGEDCGCDDDTCEFDEANGVLSDKSMTMIMGVDYSADIMNEDEDEDEIDSDEIEFVHGEEFVAWMNERLKE